MRSRGFLGSAAFPFKTQGVFRVEELTSDVFRTPRKGDLTWPIAGATTDAPNRDDFSSRSFSPSVTSIGDVYIHDRYAYILDYGPNEINQYEFEDDSLYLPTLNRTRIANSSPVGSSPYGFTFKPDGTEVYVIDITWDNVTQMSLTEAWNVSTAAMTANSVTLVEQPSSSSIELSSDGTKAFLLDYSRDNITQYTLSTAWDASSMNPLPDVSVSLPLADFSTPSCMRFSPDGTVLNIGDSVRDNIVSYTLSSAWDITTMTKEDTLRVTQEAAISGLAWAKEGTVMYICGTGDDGLNAYGLGKATAYIPRRYPLGARTWPMEEEIGMSTLAPYNIQWSNNGEKFYVLDNSSNVLQFSASTPWMVDTLSLDASTQTLETAIGDSAAFSGMWWNEDGTKVMLVQTPDIELRVCSVSSPYDITSTITYDATSGVLDSDLGRGLAVSPDGKKVIVSQTGDDVYFSIPLDSYWDVASAATHNNLRLAGKSELAPYVNYIGEAYWCMSRNGRYLYSCSTSIDAISQIRLVEPFNLNTAIYNSKELRLNRTLTTVVGLTTSYDGRYIYFWDSVDTAPLKSQLVQIDTFKS